MNKICEFIIDSITNDYDEITYYIKQSQQDLISYNYYDTLETIDYICDSIHEYFNKYNYEIIINYNELLITFIYKNYKYDISSKILFDECLYWILTISKIHHNNI